MASFSFPLRTRRAVRTLSLSSSDGAPPGADAAAAPASASKVTIEEGTSQSVREEQAPPAFLLRNPRCRREVELLETERADRVDMHCEEGEPQTATQGEEVPPAKRGRTKCEACGAWLYNDHFNYDGWRNDHSQFNYDAWLVWQIANREKRRRMANEASSSSGLA